MVDDEERTAFRGQSPLSHSGWSPIRSAASNWEDMERPIPDPGACNFTRTLSSSPTLQSRPSLNPGSLLQMNSSHCQSQILQCPGQIHGCPQVWTGSLSRMSPEMEGAPCCDALHCRCTPDARQSHIYPYQLSARSGALSLATAVTANHHSQVSSVDNNGGRTASIAPCRVLLAPPTAAHSRRF